MKHFIPLFVPALSLVTGSAVACSFGPGYELGRPPEFRLEPVANTEYPPPVLAPALTRGFDDGDYASCSDAAILTFTLGEELDRNVDGYEFRLVSGEFPDSVSFPEFPVRPIILNDTDHGFRFVWLDLPAGRSVLEPIDVTIEIRRHSIRSEVSRPLTIRITHQGGFNRTRRPASFDIDFEQGAE